LGIGPRRLDVSPARRLAFVVEANTESTVIEIEER